jgi:L-arabinokinase
VAFYISGHGFGHASRQVEIINTFGRRHPGAPILVRSTAARWLLERTIHVPFDLDDRPVDTGMTQLDSLHLDVARSIANARAFYATFDARAEAEARLLRDRGVRLVICDAPPLACEAAARAGIASVVVSNFTWDWIYAEYREYLAAAPELIPIIQAAYRRAHAAWRLPLHGGFETFAPDRIVDIPFVSRHADPARSRDDVLGDLSIPVDRPVALASFGGHGAAALGLETLDCLDEWTVVVTGPGQTRQQGRVHVVSDEDVYRNGYSHVDLLAAADAVVTKPGYGIISECVAHAVPMVYTSRGRFAEYDVMVREMPRYLPSAFLDNASLTAGRWRAALTAAVNAPAPPRRPPTNGGEVVADMMAACLRDESSSPAPRRC